jgi:magnesium transporter
MTFLYKLRTDKIGLPPGTIESESEKPVEQKISLIEYSSGEVSERGDLSIDDLLPLPADEQVHWINIEGAQPATLKRIQSGLGIHPLVLEDILHLGQRPKVEDHGDYIFIVLKMVYTDDGGQITAEQVSIVLGANYLITFQERPGDVFENIRQRIRKGSGIVRSQGADYLAYALLDAIVDNYFYLIENVDERIEAVDRRLMIEQDTSAVADVHLLKRDLILLRKQLWPVREVVSGFMKSDNISIVQDNTRTYLHDVYEHIIQITEMIDSFREMASSLHDVYLSLSGNRMNEVMKTLTIFAAIFIPLTFVAGIYGMNFEYMPELGWHWGYFGALALMATIALAMLIAFKRRKWF